MNPPKMPIHIGDLYRDTGHLRAQGFGGYLALMFHYWSTGSLPDDDEQLATIARMTKAEWRKHKPVLKAFFKEGWTHKRIDYDLEKARKVSESASNAGTASAQAKAQRKANENSTSVQRPLNETPTSLVPSNHLEREDTADAVPTYAFENGIIRLTEKDFEKWRLAFTHLDLRAELIALTDWANQQGQGKWFFAVSGALAKRNREVKAAHDKPANDANKSHWGNRIPGIA